MNPTYTLDLNILPPPDNHRNKSFSIRRGARILGWRVVPTPEYLEWKRLFRRAWAKLYGLNARIDGYAQLTYRVWWGDRVWRDAINLEKTIADTMSPEPKECWPGCIVDDRYIARAILDGVYIPDDDKAYRQDERIIITLEPAPEGSYNPRAVPKPRKQKEIK